MHLGNTTTNMYENCKYIQEMKAISKRCEEIDVCGKVTLRSKLWEIVFPDK